MADVVLECHGKTIICKFTDRDQVQGSIWNVKGVFQGQVSSLPTPKMDSANANHWNGVPIHATDSARSYRYDVHKVGSEG